MTPTTPKDAEDVDVNVVREYVEAYETTHGGLRAQLIYKGEYAGRSVSVVSEHNTTRACSNCGQLTGPRGLRQLVVRRWTCDCGVSHDRDVNAARNILRCAEVSASVCGNERSRA